MSDVFLSYSSADRAVAQAIERALSAAGYSVFWDQETPPGQDWDSWIRAKLAEAKAVIVLWSKASIASPNVRHEAMIARDAARLIPVMVEPLAPSDFPMGLYLVQGVVLDRWRGEAADPAFQRLLAEIAARLDRPPPPRAPVRSGPRIGVIVGVAVVLAALAGVGYLAMQATRAAPIVQAARVLEGSWHWQGLACGAGPIVARDGDMLVFTMTGAPDYRHAIESADAAHVRTLLIAPEAERGTTYAFARTGDRLTVTTLADGRVDEWERCS